MADTKLLWHSNSPWSPTGYGNQTGLVAPRLKAEYDLAISAFYGLEAARLEWNNIPVLPGMGQTYGNEVIREHAKGHFGDLRGGIVLTLLDVWVLDCDVWRTMNVAAWCPVDHAPPPPMVERFFAQTQAVPIAMSRFGAEQLGEFDPLYVPHAVDCKVFRRYPKAPARKRIGLPKDAFVVGVVAANKGNPSRKCFPEMLEAFAALRQRHDDAVLYLHTELSGKQQGVNLPALIKALKLPAKSVLFCDQYRLEFDPYPTRTMAEIYSGIDVLLNTSTGEGFGIPVLEAQACGTPAIVTDFSAMPEVCGAGWHVEHDLFWTPQLSWQARPKVDDILDALEQAYRTPAAGWKQFSEKARAHAEGYHVDRVVGEYMLPALKEVEERFAERKPRELVAA